MFILVHDRTCRGSLYFYYLHSDGLAFRLLHEAFFLVLFVVHNLICFVSAYGRFGRGISFRKHTFPIIPFLCRIQNKRLRCRRSFIFGLRYAYTNGYQLDVHLMKENMGSNERGKVTSIYDNTIELGQERLSAGEDGGLKEYMLAG